MTTGLIEIVQETASPPRSTSGVVPARAAAPVGGPAGRAFTGLTKLRPGAEAKVVAYLTALGTDIKASVDIAFSDLRAVHFLRW
ncbi:MAG TPA: hypothetical protein VJT73_14310, partial [Polyangiaceae bacterium]|nr:hypothetical protein [Polyangiaceae bacterium]